MEVLQAAFWSLDPARTVAKFAEFGRLASDSAEARRFVELEERANEGEPLPYAAARELIEDMLAATSRATANGWWAAGRCAANWMRLCSTSSPLTTASPRQPRHRPGHRRPSPRGMSEWWWIGAERSRAPKISHALPLITAVASGRTHP